MKPAYVIRRIIETCAVIAALFDIGLFVTEHVGRTLFIGSMALTCLVIVSVVYFDPASRLRHLLRRIRRLFDHEPIIKWFVEREAARPDMCREWQRHSWLVFVGFSQRSLSIYLDNEMATGAQYPWKSVEIYFASDQLGSAFEEHDFLPNVRRSRQEIAAELTSLARSAQLPALTELQFYQYDALVGYSGSFFGSRPEEEPKVIYIVESLPVRRGEAKRALTFKISADGTEEWNSGHRAALEHYRRGYRTIRESRRSLGRFAPSLWDRSAADWSQFCRVSTVMGEEMQGLIEFAGALHTQHVLDLGCGSGEMSQRLLRAGVLSLTALDCSPQMLRCTKRKLADKGNVHFALCRVPTDERENIDIEDRKFGRIVLHQGLPAFASTVQEIETLARWCWDYLEDGGRLLLAAHNTVVRLDNVEWTDLFLENLRATIAADPDCRSCLRPTWRPFDLAEVENAFKVAGYTVEKRVIRSFRMTMAERRLLWKVPAVIDSLIDVKGTDIERARNLVENVADRLRAFQTKERTVVYWSFQR